MEAATSQTLLFLVGADKKEFRIHSFYIFKHSTLLKKTFINSAWDKPRDVAEFLDIEPLTFLSFWQFVYTGDYDDPSDGPEPPEVPEPPEPEPEVPELDDPVEPEPPEPGLEPQPIPDDDLAPAINERIYLSKKDKKKARKGLARKKEGRKEERGYACKLLLDDLEADNALMKESLAGTFKNQVWLSDFIRSWEDPYSPRNVSVSSTPVPSKSPLHHAKVYVMSTRYKIVGLMNTSFGKLHQALISYNLAESGHDGIMVLLEYCFTHPAPEELKRLVAHWAACSIEQLWAYPEFQTLIKDHGELATATIRKLLRRIN